ncbi:hypothetical protein RRG08_029499 [Elysia crispata]|uniref:Uncharacterized protein n=1 Tax=Elysia crispata TaxID=231223 RepID=A0AAE1DHB9_9GAST|nr:hypothetical protein RRG08_029499 [Elysia crispata]
MADCKDSITPNPPAAPRKPRHSRRRSSFSSAHANNVTFENHDLRPLSDCGASAISRLDLAVSEPPRSCAPAEVVPEAAAAAGAIERPIMTSTPSRSGKGTLTLRPQVSPLRDPRLKTTPIRCAAAPSRPRLFRQPAILGGVMGPKRLPFFLGEEERVFRAGLSEVKDMSFVECEAESTYEETMSIGQQDYSDIEMMHQSEHNSVAMETEGESLVVFDVSMTEFSFMDFQ